MALQVNFCCLCFKDFLFLCLVLSNSKAEFLGEDVKIKFIFDSYDYDNHDMANTSSILFPFSYNLRNVSLAQYHPGEGNTRQYDPDEGNTSNRRENMPGRSLEIGQPDKNKIGTDITEVSSLQGEGDKKCLDKLVIETFTEYKEELKCDHSYDRQCHTSYITTYQGQQTLYRQVQDTLYTASDNVKTHKRLSALYNLLMAV